MAYTDQKVIDSPLLVEEEATRPKKGKLLKIFRLLKISVLIANVLALVYSLVIFVFPSVCQFTVELIHMENKTSEAKLSEILVASIGEKFLSYSACLTAFRSLNILLIPCVHYTGNDAFFGISEVEFSTTMKRSLKTLMSSLLINIAVYMRCVQLEIVDYSYLHESFFGAPIEPFIGFTVTIAAVFMALAFFFDKYKTTKKSREEVKDKLIHETQLV